MSQNQEFELKLAVKHHPSLKTDQLIQFLQNQANQFLTNDLPHSLTQDHFTTIFETPQGSQQQNSDDYNEYVGLMLLYSSSSLDSFEFINKAIPNQEALADLFMIIVQMDNTDKKCNAIGDEGAKMCSKNGYQFVKLTLYNSQDLVNILHRNLYELIENYYYPNQEQKPSKKQYQSQYQFQYGKSQIQLPQVHNNHQQNQKTKSPKKRKILATKEDKKSLQKLLDKASQLRQSRNDYIEQEQRQIDEAIQNVEQVLCNLNEHINDKVKANWYTSLKHTLFSPLQKNSTSFAKIKLTQEFIDQTDQDMDQEIGLFLGQKISKKQTMSKMSRKTEIGRPSKNAMINKFINATKRKDSLMKVILAVADSVIVQLEIFQDTNFDDLALVAMQKIGITETQHNYNLMREIIVERVEEYIRELTKAVKLTQKIRIQDRSFLNKRKWNQGDQSQQKKDKSHNNGQYYSFR